MKKVWVIDPHSSKTPKQVQKEIMDEGRSREMGNDSVIFSDLNTLEECGMTETIEYVLSENPEMSKTEDIYLLYNW